MGCQNLPTFNPLARILPAKPSPDDQAGDSNWYTQSLAANRAKKLAEEEKRSSPEDQLKESRLAQARRGESPAKQVAKKDEPAELDVALEAPKPLSTDDLNARPRTAGAPGDGQSPRFQASNRASTGVRLASVDRVGNARSEKRKDPGLPVSDHEAISRILDKARQRLDRIETYQLTLLGTERIGGSLTPAEEMVLSVRRNPKAVRLEWAKGSHKGREVLYRTDGPDNLMHVNMADMGLLRSTLALDPTSPLAMRNSRHPITEAGLDTIVEKLESALEQKDHPEPKLGKLTYAGIETPEGYMGSCFKVVRVTPEGETWIVDFDKTTGLPAVSQATSKTGQLLERYIFSNVVSNPPELADAQAFDPQARWGNSKGPAGFLQKIARGNFESKPTTEVLTK